MFNHTKELGWDLRELSSQREREKLLSFAVSFEFGCWDLQRLHMGLKAFMDVAQLMVLMQKLLGFEQA